MTFGSAPPRRRPSLTPMIDVVFLLLVFFMLASRFGTDLQLPLNVGGNNDGAAYQGPPRLIDVRPDGVRVNGTATQEADLITRMEALSEDATDTIVLRARDGASLQRVVAVMELLGEGGFKTLVLVE